MQGFSVGVDNSDGTMGGGAVDMVIDFTVGGWQFDDNTEFIDEPDGSRRRVDRENGTFTASSDTDFNVCIRVYDSNWRDRSNPAAGGWAMCDTCEVRYNDWARWDTAGAEVGYVDPLRVTLQPGDCEYAVIDIDPL